MLRSIESKQTISRNRVMIHREEMKDNQKNLDKNKIRKTPS